MTGGRLGLLTLARPDGSAFERRPTIPDSGVPVEGVEVPLWEAVVDEEQATGLARDAGGHCCCSSAPSGFDIALTQGGPA